MSAQRRGKWLKTGGIGLLLAGAAGLIAHEYLSEFHRVEYAMPAAAAPGAPVDGVAGQAEKAAARAAVVAGDEGKGRPKHAVARRSLRRDRAVEAPAEVSASSPGAMMVAAVAPLSPVATPAVASPVVTAPLAEGTAPAEPAPVLDAAVSRTAETAPAVAAGVPAVPAERPAAAVATAGDAARPAKANRRSRPLVAVICGWDPQGSQVTLTLPPVAVIAAACAVPFELAGLLDDGRRGSPGRPH